MTLAHGGSVPDPIAAPSAESLARTAEDVANAATLLASLTRRSDVTGDAAHRAERALHDAREALARAYLNVGGGR